MNKNFASEPTFYFISDLHLSAVEDNNVCEFKNELINFLKELSREDTATELIIVGDMFGLWEMTNVELQKKIHRVIHVHKDIFEQFKLTGSKIRITVIPGNHDQEMMFIRDIKESLAVYNIHFEKRDHIIRQIGSRKIWIEHGSQYDDYNKFPDFKKKGVPLGYYVAQNLVSNAKKHAEKGKDDWLKDIASVYPNEEVPKWVFSNYFYREMNPFIRYTVLPFLLLLTISSLFGLGLLLNRTHIINTAIVTPSIFGNIKVVGGILELIVMVDIVILAIAAAAAIPYFIISTDIKRAFRRYGLDSKNGLKAQKEHKYLDAAARIGHDRPEVKFFVYGHTHHPSIKKNHGIYVINTGTWIKRLERVKSIFRFLPSVYFPSYRLSYIKLSKKGNHAHIHYGEIQKDYRPELTILQKLVIAAREKRKKVALIADTKIPIQ